MVPVIYTMTPLFLGVKTSCSTMRLTQFVTVRTSATGLRTLS